MGVCGSTKNEIRRKSNLNNTNINKNNKSMLLLQFVNV